MLLVYFYKSAKILVCVLGLVYGV